MTKAYTVLAATQNERDRAQTALTKAETAHAKAMASVIKSGGKPDTGITPTIRTAQQALAEAELRLRMSFYVASARG